MCVAGAGYAGLAAARRVVQGGASAVVLEARDRVAGRVWTRSAPDGTPIDAGGTWLGPGQDAAYKPTASPIEMTLDASPRDGIPGVLAAFGFGPHARTLAAPDPAERRRIVLATLVDRFGPRAGQPIHYEELDWADERWTRGCYMAHMAPGVLTQFGRALRAPVGRIHWAGTETATVSHGTIDGAIRSGERAAAEVLAAD